MQCMKFLHVMKEHFNTYKCNRPFSSLRCICKSCAPTWLMCILSFNLYMFLGGNTLFCGTVSLKKHYSLQKPAYLHHYMYAVSCYKWSDRASEHIMSNSHPPPPPSPLRLAREYGGAMYVPQRPIIKMI